MLATLLSNLLNDLNLGESFQNICQVLCTRPFFKTFNDEIESTESFNYNQDNQLDLVNKVFLVIGILIVSLYMRNDVDNDGRDYSCELCHTYRNLLPIYLPLLLQLRWLDSQLIFSSFFELLNVIKLELECLSSRRSSRLFFNLFL